MLRLKGRLVEPVSFARTLTRCGLSLRKAHDVLNRVASGEEVATILPAVSSKAAIGEELARLNIDTDWRDVPDDIDVRAIRARLGLTQAEFAARFAFDLNTLQNWEQGRNRPDRSSRALLQIIDRNPRVVEENLRSKSAYSSRS